MQGGSQRRVHGAELKARVILECRQGGASVAATALKHGLNANLVRSWLGGRGLKRSGLSGPGTVALGDRGSLTGTAAAAPALRFLPVALNADPLDGAEPTVREASVRAPVINIEVVNGETQLSVQWPASHAAACGIWLRDLVAVAK